MKREKLSLIIESNS